MCFLSGAVITIMGVLHLGFLVDFISMPVICGFSNAAAIIIAASQLGTLLGIKGRSDSFIDSISKVINHINETQPWDTTLGVCSMIVLVLLKVPSIKLSDYYKVYHKEIIIFRKDFELLIIAFY